MWNEMLDMHVAGGDADAARAARAMLLSKESELRLKRSADSSRTLNFWAEKVQHDAEYAAAKPVAAQTGSAAQIVNPGQCKLGKMDQIWVFDHNSGLVAFQAAPATVDHLDLPAHLVAMVVMVVWASPVNLASLVIKLRRTRASWNG